MNYPKSKFIITRESFSFDRAYEVRVGRQLSDGKWAIMQPVEFKVIEEPFGTRPAFAMSRDDCQELMDELWRVGIRPSEGTGSAGSLAATERHLADLRALVFKTGAPTK